MQSGRILRNRSSYSYYDGNESEELPKRPTRRSSRTSNRDEDLSDSSNAGHRKRTRHSNSSVSTEMYDIVKTRRRGSVSTRSSQHDDDNVEEDAGRKYSFRHRTPRETMNISNLGGDYGGYKRNVVQTEEEDDENEEEVNDEENEENDEDNEEEEEEEDENVKTYSFRNRNRTQREFMNISHLGGDGGSYKTSSHGKSKHDRNSSRISYKETGRLYLGGRLKSPPRHKKRHHHVRHRSKHRRHYDSSSESSSSGSGSSSSSGSNRRGRYGSDNSSDDNDDKQFRKHEERRLRKERDSVLPVELGSLGGSVRDKVSRKDLNRADVMPVAVDASVGFSSVGGLDSHVQALKEMVVLPLLYPDVFEKFDTQPPRGVLFVGPPGTGKVRR